MGYRQKEMVMGTEELLALEINYRAIQGGGWQNSTGGA